LIDLLEQQRGANGTADLAFTAMRDLKRSAWKPFMKAALERNPVCLTGSWELNVPQAAARLESMENASIYGCTRMAQPDEVWNYGRGDGLEKAVCLLNIAKAREPQGNARIDGDGGTVVVRSEGREYRFLSRKKRALPTEDDGAFGYEPSGVPMEPRQQPAAVSASSFE